MPPMKTFRHALGHFVPVIHAARRNGCTVCAARQGSRLRVTHDPALVTCRHCQAKGPISVHYAPEGTVRCHHDGPCLETTADLELVTCQNCLRGTSRAAPRAQRRRTGRHRGPRLPRIYRHYGIYSAPCGTPEPGWARTLEWRLVDCPACLAVQDLAPTTDQWEAQVALLVGCVQSSWDFAACWPHVEGMRNGSLPTNGI